MYDLSERQSGPTVRIGHIRRALEQYAEVELIAGARADRRIATWRYLRSGRMRAVSGLYVESSTALPSETDLALLLVARALGTRVITYVRDAYQLFPDWHRADSPKRWLSARLFRPAMTALASASSTLAFPTRGLADAVVGRDRPALLLPPGSPAPFNVPRRASARNLLFVGDMRNAPQGGQLLLEALGKARDGGADLGLIAVVRPGGEPLVPVPSWVRIERAGSEKIPRLLPDVLATVIPRPPGAYADLALPIKLMEYLSYGRPILVTNRTETAHVIRESGAGLVAMDGVTGLADGISAIAAAPASQIDAWSAAAALAATQHGWEHQAATIMAELGL